MSEPKVFWDWATGPEYVQIEIVTGQDNDREVLSVVASIPLDTPDAEGIAEAICNAHNEELP